MTAVWCRLQAELRSGWRSLLVIALLVGLAGGAVLAGLAAARRTGSAYSRMRESTNAWDVEVNPNNGSDSKLTVAALRKLPGVEAIGRIDGLMLYPSVVKSMSDAFSLPPIVYTDDHATYTIGRPLMVAGRRPAPDDPDGVWVEKSFADSRHLKVGQSFSYTILTPALLEQAMSQRSEADAAAVVADAPAELRGTARIEGIGVVPDGVVVDPGYTPASFVFTPAFKAAHRNLQSPYWGAMVKLKPGTDVDAFTARVRALVPDESIAFQRAAAVTAEVDNATDPQVIALEAFAAVAALLGLVVVSQTISRRLQVDARHNSTLAAIGFTRSQRMAASMAKSMLAVAVGALLAVVITVVSSSVAPVGAVRIAEVDPGITFDWPLLLLGTLALVIVGALLAAVPAWRSSRIVSVGTVARRSRIAAAVAAAGGSLAAVVGVRFALERGNGSASVPIRTTLLAAATAVALVTTVVVFSAGLDHLVATPRLYGSAWDGQIELDNLNSSNDVTTTTPAAAAAAQARFVDLADHSGSIAASSLLQVGEVRSGSLAIPAIGLVPRHPAVQPTVDGGRAPRSPNEVALGQTTMDQLHTRIGATIRLAVGEQGPARAVRVVGRAILPGLAPYPGSDKAGLGVGALLTNAGWKRYSTDFQKTEYIFRWRPGRSLATLTSSFTHSDPKELPLSVDPINRPSGIVSVERLRATPTLLGALVAALLAAAVANALVVTVRRRRRDLAVLRTLGFTAGEVVRTVLWQATTVAVVAVVIGIPVGVIVGRWSWTLLADRLGTIADPLVNGAALIVVAAAVLLLSNAVGVVPGFRAARHPARALRAE